MKKELTAIKGNRDGLTVLLDDQAQWEDILTDLKNRLNGKNGVFFEGASVTLELGRRRLSPEQVSRLWEIFEGSGLSISGLKTGCSKKENAETKGSRLKAKEWNFYMNEKISRVPTLVVSRSIRSGQDVTFAGNVIVFGDAKPGSKITASGFVLVLGSLLGTVHAGAEGDEDVWVAALRLEPTQLRIAGYITRAPDEKPSSPEIARIQEGMVIVKEWKNITSSFEIMGGIG
ncbi:MAG: septum site-determining protein MinC [Peptococcaceae bacterium]|jgi:septum site-determining protein MinC|nr:hypothetical protein [Peptococcaceae bacterium]MDH7524244.1 septum site-determining protein MinC [Peptococcaceae bacterium]